MLLVLLLVQRQWLSSGRLVDLNVGQVCDRVGTVVVVLGGGDLQLDGALDLLRVLELTLILY